MQMPKVPDSGDVAQGIINEATARREEQKITNRSVHLATGGVPDELKRVLGSDWKRYVINPATEPTQPKLQEKAELVDSIEVIAEDLTNNKEGLFVGLNEIQRGKLRRDVGDAVMVEEVVDGKSRVRAFMVGTHLSKNHKMPEVVSSSDIALLKRKITIRAPHADLTQEKMVYATATDLEKDDKHKVRIGKVRNALEGIEGVEPEAYVSIPAGLMKLYGFKASDSPTVLKVDKATLVYKGKEHTVGVIPGGREIRFTTTAVAKMNIEAEQLQVSIRDGKLILEDVDLQED